MCSKDTSHFLNDVGEDGFSLLSIVVGTDVEERQGVLAGTGAKVHVHKRDAHESVCVECKLYHTLKVQGVEACAGVADDFIARQGAIRDDGSVDFNRVVGDGSVEGLVRGERSPIRFEHPVSGRCGATAAEVLSRPRG